eukprot:CAMPEP_0179405116 /NCGR_PEP_ID=MMETSP0799-20121207/91_1 /TAXON_ID=46947 /ORGANISM="Geminigera cryophila, Strain CCMP2564" /LENGTH=126 /DNA_ID=CAMNT_0021175895 /DNA_START=157 /DNA_END=537 /DNA_ORIENTATION=+
MIASQVYMSPERIQGANYTSNCDVWSIGVVLVEMMTGKHPYDQGAGLEDVHAVIIAIEEMDPPVLLAHHPEVSESVAALSTKCMVWSREHRPTAAQLMEEDEWLRSYSMAPDKLAPLISFLSDMRP